MDEHNNPHPSSIVGDLPVAFEGTAAPTREVVVNGRNCLVRADDLSHAQLVKLAFPALNALERPSLTVSYRGGPHTSPDGVLAPDERTPLADGETFVVTRTNKS